ncbi:MAG: hypothetical protein U5O16_19785 [Rhodococcus sp. (in: high G+C Gram-positive bacteria)]|uniref:hypothetical protein n=1 Tax=Rhodococcus sp. TaxID=1831 RepID=UPI002AD99D19|nr:hypothetical protein [Rhodococcus sp. (in: high G+C Gram-positive bacteria)]
MIRYTCGDCGWGIAAPDNDEYVRDDIWAHQEEHRVETEHAREDQIRTEAVAGVESLQPGDIHILVALLTHGDNELLINTVNEVKARNRFRPSDGN